MKNLKIAGLYQKVIDAISYGDLERIECAFDEYTEHLDKRKNKGHELLELMIKNNDISKENYNYYYQKIK